VRREQGRFREEFRLNLTVDSLVALALDSGFHRAGIVEPASLLPWADGLRSLSPKGYLDSDRFRGMELGWVLEPAGWSGSAAILVCCLSCNRSEPDDLSSPGDPHGLIAPFARRNYYRTAVQFLRRVSKRLEEERGIPSRAIRIFCNSRIPEKSLLAASAVAARGRNSLMIAPGLGSLFIISGLILPIPTASLGQEQGGPSTGRFRINAWDPCGSCDLCIDACPVKAISENGRVDAERCLQGLAETADLLEPSLMSKWGTRIYGCQECQAVCPHNRGLSEETATRLGEIGPSVPLRTILSMDRKAVKEFFQGTPMGSSRVQTGALIRNALIAAGNSGDASLRRFTESHAKDESEPLRRTAEWALGRLDGISACRP
jgi:epoxyqueuosine reductase